MQCTRIVGLVLLALATCHGARLDDKSKGQLMPLEKALQMVQDMKTQLMTTGATDQASMTTYQCWCDNTANKKSVAINAAKNEIVQYSEDIVKNQRSAVQSQGLIRKLTLDIANNIAELKEATEARDQGHSDFEKASIVAEGNIAAMEGAITALAGAGAGKTAFLGTSQQTKLQGLAAAMVPMMKTGMGKSLKDVDREVVDRFLAKPEEFFKGGQSALQTEQNPAGDYAPASTQIQGIFKSMYDTFVGDLEQSDADEAGKQKGFLLLEKEKNKEKANLKKQMKDEEKLLAGYNGEVASNKDLKDKSKAQVKADEKYFAQSQDNCRAKNRVWSQRSAMRSQEIDGMQQTINLLKDEVALITPEQRAAWVKKVAAAKQTNAGAEFLQLSAVVHRPREEAYKRLKAVATRYQSLELAQMAIAAKKTGQFDDIVAQVEKMLVVLHEEDKDDIGHRDRCESKQNENQNNMEDAEKGTAASKKEIERLTIGMQARTDKIKELGKQIVKIEGTAAESVMQRMKEAATYKKNAEANRLLREDMANLRNKLSQGFKEKDAEAQKKLSLVQEQGDPITPSVKEPGTTFGGSASYKTASSAGGGGVLAILQNLVESFEFDQRIADKAEEASQVAFVTELANLNDMKRCAADSKASQGTERSKMGDAKQEAQNQKQGFETDEKTEEKQKKALLTDCAWVKMQFKDRAEKRKIEINSLYDTKNFFLTIGGDNDLSLREA